MKEGFRQSMAWLHTWTGLLCGWLLFAMFLTGTTAYFQEEITRWMQPEAMATASPEDATSAAIRYLETRAPDAASWYITPPSARNATTALFWVPTKRVPRGESSATLDGNGVPIAARDTKGGYFLYRFHYDLHYMPVIWARYLVGIAAMFMLVAILSGIVTHKKIFVDFFMLRFGKGQRSWLDAHNVTAVFALPFYLMITYTGLVTLATLYMPWPVAANYTSPLTYFNAAFPAFKPVSRAGDAAPLVPVTPLMRDAAQRWGGAPVGAVSILAPGDANARIVITRAPSGAIGSRGETIIYSGTTGALIDPGAAKGGAAVTESVMIGLHAGRFAGWALRWLYFLSGVLGTVMVGTGLVLWTAKRRDKLANPNGPHFGFRFVARMNIAAIAGLPAGIAAYFIANRLLPIGMAARADWEIHSLFLVWLATLLWAIVRPERRAWIEGLTLAAVLYAAVPIVNALTVPRNFVTGLWQGDWLFAAFDPAMLIVALCFAVAARKAARPKAVGKRVRRSQPVMATA